MTQNHNFTDKHHWRGNLIGKATGSIKIGMFPISLYLTKVRKSFKTFQAIPQSLIFCFRPLTSFQWPD